MEQDKQQLHRLRHDVNNQLSNIQLCISELKYEVKDPSPDYTFYLETIMTSCGKIQELLTQAVDS
jgi:hypothetical protein